MAKKTNSELEQIFETYRRTAPLLDLQFYLRAAERKLATHELPDETIRIIAEMTALESELIDVDGTASHKKRVWTLIDRYKGSIPGWAGNLGAPGYFVEPVESASSYFVAREAMVRADERVRIDSDGTAHHDKPKKPGAFTAEGPVTEAQILSFSAPALKRAEELRRERVPQRDEPLSAEALRALITAQMIEPPQNVRKPAMKKPAAIDPDVKSYLRTMIAARRIVFEPWMARYGVEQPAAKPRRVMAKAADTIDQAASVEGARTCRQCRVEQPIEQFTYGDGGRTARHLCKTCHRQQQRDAAARRKQAA